MKTTKIAFMAIVLLCFTAKSNAQSEEIQVQQTAVAVVSTSSMTLTGLMTGAYTSLAYGPAPTAYFGFKINTGSPVTITSASFSVNGGAPIFYGGAPYSVNQAQIPTYVGYNGVTQVISPTIINGSSVDGFYLFNLAIPTGGTNQQVSFTTLTSAGLVSGSANYVVPEPSTYLLLAAAGAFFLIMRHRTRSVSRN